MAPHGSTVAPVPWPRRPARATLRMGEDPGAQAAEPRGPAMPTPANCNHSPRLGAHFDAWACETGLIIGRGDLRGHRLAAAAHLDALPAAALAQMGIAPADIPRIVFRDLFAG